MKRLAVIGIGSWGSRVAREAAILLKNGAIDSLSLCDIKKEKMDAFKRNNSELLKDISGISFHSNADSVVKGGIDFAHICTQNSAHLEVASLMVKNKIPFIVEKPVSDKISEVNAMEKLIKANKGLVAKNGLIFRFDNSIKEAKKLYKNDLGKVHFLRFYWEFTRDYMPNVDIIWDLMPHLIDIFHFITNEESHFVAGIKTQFRRKNDSELATIILETQSGVKGVFNISWFSSRKNRIIEIFGEKKMLRADILEQSITLFDSKDINRSDTVQVAKNNTIADELTNLINDAQSGKNTVNNIEIGIGIAKYLDLIDKKSKPI